MLNMAKKKVSQVVYTPLVTTQTPNETTTVSQTIPNYEDSGVKYMGKFKIKKSVNEYELKSQYTRLYSYILSNIAIQTSTIPRVDISEKFFCIYVHIEFYLASGTTCQVIVYDNTNTNPKFRFVLRGTGTGQNGFYTLDFSGCPREFSGANILFDNLTALAATDYIQISMYGWQEQV